MMSGKISWKKLSGLTFSQPLGSFLAITYHNVTLANLEIITTYYVRTRFLCPIPVFTLMFVIVDKKLVRFFAFLTVSLEI